MPLRRDNIALSQTCSRAFGTSQRRPFSLAYLVYSTSLRSPCLAALEGFAYLSAQIQEVIDDQIPEFSGGLIKKFFPHYLRPLPSATIMSFTPKTELSESFTVKKGTSFSSIPVDKAPRLFRLCSDCIVHPLVVESARMVSHSGEQHYIELTIALSGIDLESWWVNQLTFHLGGLFAEAAQLYYLLLRHVDKIELTNNHSTLTLPKHSITAAGFSDDEALLPYPAHASTAYRVLHRVPRGS